MPTELLVSKLFIPPIRPGLVPRPRLIQLLNEGLTTECKLTLISAPAGFGKTTLVVGWLNQLELPAAWLSLDEADNNLSRFLAYLAASVQKVDEEIGAPILSALQSPLLPAAEVILTGLLNDIAARTDPLILVLDDFHLLTDAAILDGMEFLIQHQPSQLHVLITTREDPGLPLARLRARNQLTEIRARDLRFTRREAEVFLREAMGLVLSEQDVARLEDRTEGWAVGLQLAGLSLQKQANPQTFIADFSGSHRHILDYLTSEVLQQQPEDIQVFLLQTSILDRLNGPLCDAVTQRHDSSKLLLFLEAANLFVIPLDEERRWYRYHHLFSDLLRNQLTRTQPELISELHRRASCWYEEQSDIESSIDHALKESDLTEAARLIEQYTFPKLYQGQIAMVVGWFDRLRDAILEAAPMLCISKAWALALMQRGMRRTEVDQALKAAAYALDHVNADEEHRSLVVGHVASIQAFLLRNPAGNSETREKLIALSREARRLLPGDAKAIRSINDLNIGYAYLGLADLESASPAFHEALEDGLAGGNFYAAIYGPINLILIARLQGRINEALQLCEENLNLFNRILAGQYFPPIGALYILKGSLLFEQNQLADAEQLLKDGLDLIRWTGESVTHRQGYTALAYVRAIQGDHPGMLEAVKALEESLPNDAIYAQALRQRLLLHFSQDDGDLQKNAQLWLSQSGIEFGKLEIVNRLNPASTAKFESYLNSTHVLASLAKAIPGAYNLDDVQAHLRRQAEFAETHGVISWIVTVAIARTVLYLASGKKDKALNMLEVALSAAASTGLFRVFLDESELLQALLKELTPKLSNEILIAYASRLLEAFSDRTEKPETGEKHKALLSERELEVLRCLASGLSYEETGQKLFLSLNTIQSHVKNIYRKLQVNKRLQAIEKAREINLI